MPNNVMWKVAETVIVFIGRVAYMLVLTPFLHDINGVGWWASIGLSLFITSFLTLLCRISAAAVELLGKTREIASAVTEMRRECTRMSNGIKEINETMQYQWEEKETR